MAEALLADGSVATGWRVLARSRQDKYTVGFARGPAEIAEAQALRFEVFHLELNEGHDESLLSGLDQDIFDSVCDHLLIRETATNRVVGTYRLQTGMRALLHHGYYSEQEFDLSGFEPYRAWIVELGRACVHRAHRNVRVLSLLWRGIAGYVLDWGARYLIGCSSLSSQNPGEGAALFRHLWPVCPAPAPFRVTPLPGFECDVSGSEPDASCRVPKLLAAYLSLGARICGPPAIDREFKTIDFLTLLDLRSLNPAAARLYLGPEWAASFEDSFVPPG